MDITSCSLIEGSSKLVSLFGEWPAFRDAAIIYVRIDRGEPTVTIALELPEWTERHPGENLNVTLRWCGVTDFSLSGINPQPALGGMSLLEADGAIRTTLRARRGPHGQIVAGRLRVLDVAIVEA